MPDLTAGDEAFRADTGQADAAVAAALAALAAGTGSEHATLTALAGARLLVPVVAITAEALAEGGDKGSEMAMPAIVGQDGRQALPAFTCLQALQRWQPDARPVPVPASSVWQAAVGQSQAVIIDLAGPVPLAVEGARLAALASGAPIPRLHEDPDVRAAVAAVAASRPPGIRIRLGPPFSAADFTLELASADPAAGQPVARSEASAIAAEVAARLTGRLSRGIAVRLR